jgi:uncharacterized protein (TIGR00251 family)
VTTSFKKSGRAEKRLPVKLKLKVVPGASRSEICGWLGEMLKVRISAPPEKGKANAAVEALVARALDLPAGSARIVGGASSQKKVIEIQGLTSADIQRKLGTIMSR